MALPPRRTRRRCACFGSSLPQATEWSAGTTQPTRIGQLGRDVRPVRRQSDRSGPDAMPPGRAPCDQNVSRRWVSGPCRCPRICSWPDAWPVVPALSVPSTTRTTAATLSAMVTAAVVSRDALCSHRLAATATTTQTNASTGPPPVLKETTRRFHDGKTRSLVS